MSNPMIAAQMAAELDEFRKDRKGGFDFETAMKSYAAKYRVATKAHRELIEAVKPVIAALANLTDTDDWRGVASAMVRCKVLLDKFPDLAPPAESI